MTRIYLGESGDRPDDWTPKPRPPKAAQPVNPWSDYVLQSTDKGRAIPIVYGTAKVAGSTIFRGTPYSWAGGSNGNVYWLPSHSYVVGSICYSNGNLYVCTTAGTSTTGSPCTFFQGGSGPSGTGSSIADGTCVWSYTQYGWRHTEQIGFCEGPIQGALAAWVDKAYYSPYTQIPAENPAGLPWLYLHPGNASNCSTAGYPTESTTDNYPNTAVLGLVALTNSDSALPSISLEIQGAFATAGGAASDANPADVAIDLLTHQRRGVGWPSSRVDSTSTGSASASSWRNYCTAYGLTLSWVIDTQRSALDLLRDLLLATNTDAVWSGGALKFVPLGDAALTANGATFTPNSTAVYSLSQDDFLQPLEVRRVAAADTFNAMPVEYVDRASGYSRLTVEDADMTDVDQRGLVRGATLSLPQVLGPGAAVMLSRIRAQRSLNVRNTYRFKLGFRFMLLEPSDLLTLSDSVAGLAGQPVRVTAIEEDDDGIFVTAEDWPAGVATATAYTTQSGDGYRPNTGSNVNNIALSPGQIPTGTVSDANGTRGSNVDNLWPNPTSEMAPPNGVDTTTAEWANRFNAGASAYAGAWVRRLTCAATGTTYTQDLAVPAQPGDSYYAEAYVKASATIGTPVQSPPSGGGWVQIGFYNASGSLIGTATSSTVLNATAWTLASVRATAPSGTVKAVISLAANASGTGSAAGATVDFDNLYARRALAQEVLDRNGLGTLRSTGYTTTAAGHASQGVRIRLDGSTPALEVAASDLYIGDQGFQDGASSNIWNRVRYGTAENSGVYGWRGNASGVFVVSGTTTPSFQIQTVGIDTFTGGSGTWTMVLLHFFCADANIDGVKNIDLQLYNRVTGVKIYEQWFAMNDRPIAGSDLYARSAATLMIAGNLNSTSKLNCYARVQVNTTLGQSAQFDLDALVGTLTPWPITTGLATLIGGGGSGGGGGGGTCPTPHARILLVDGSSVEAWQLREGMRVQSFDDANPDRPLVGRIHKPAIQWADRYELALTDGRVLTFSKGHRIVEWGKGWKRIEDFRGGERVAGPFGGVVKFCRHVGRGEIVAFQVLDAATYFADGAPSHNLKP